MLVDIHEMSIYKLLLYDNNIYKSRNHIPTITDAFIKIQNLGRKLGFVFHQFGIELDIVID